MNLDINKEQKMVKNSARDFLKSKFSKEVIRELEESEDGYSPKLWDEMVELGWMGLALPEEYAGMGMGFVDLTILLEEIGYNLLPGPFFSTVMGAFPILEAGTDAQKKEYLTKICDGEIKLSFAILEPSATYDPSGITVEAVPDGDDFVINGTKLFVENAHVSDYMLCPVRTGQDDDPAKGITLFMVDSNSAGIEKSHVPAMGLDKQFEVNFSNVKVPAANMIGGLNEGWEVLKSTYEKAQVGKCAEMLGGMKAAMEMTNDYVKKRITYGHPIGSYQVIQHYMSNVWLNVETSENITYLAAWKLQEGLPCSLEVSSAKAYVGQAFTTNTERCIQMHGSIGLTREHDIGLYYRHAKTCALAFGDGDYQKEVVAETMGF
jgi:alkylation response protein AidB-like acyl-CoA dehydrogenase